MKYKTAISLYIEKGNDIKNDYAKGNKTYNILAEDYGCSINTIQVVLGMLGFYSSEWVKPLVQKKIELLKKRGYKFEKEAK